MGGQYVHLATSRELALRIGPRRDRDPVIIEIHAQKAYREGIVFYQANGLIYCRAYPFPVRKWPTSAQKAETCQQKKIS